ncbi:Spy/CpxP family protein refolding chaperone [Geothrix fuzhouensis]|uniref:Spy/CpxP family protein refolding chaperone n=1 Tax=Geothrix fuzhouensis TaxID=2966451 RepID=UPI002148E36E|nr:Spy/CpxP family protein refolding chaperone [Geothrix fuzhouensis]
MTSLFRPFAILSLAVMPILAQPAPGPRDGWMARVLNLTEAQRTSIQAIREKHRPDLVAHRDKARQAQAALRAALQDPATPEAQLRVLHDKASAARFDLLLAGRAVHQEVQAVLTPEQRGKAAELRAIRQAHRQERLRHFRMAMGMAG